MSGMPEAQEPVFKRVARKVWGILGGYTLGLVLILVMMVEVFYGIFHQVGAEGGPAGAAAEWFGSPLVFVPIGGESAVLFLPLPGMWIVGAALLLNVLAGGVLKAKKGWSSAGIIVAHTGVLFLLASVVLGSLASVSVDDIRLEPGKPCRDGRLDVDLILDRFSPGFYPGTAKPKSFESELTVMNRDGGKSAKGVVKMNEPFRARLGGGAGGWTFYQMGWVDRGGESPVSVLKAVRNPYEQWPEWSAYLVCLGLAWHFCLKFFFRKREAGEHEHAVDMEKRALTPVTRHRKKILVAIGLLAVALPVAGFMGVKPGGGAVHVEGYAPWSKDFVETMGSVAVEDGGRLKPFSSYADFVMLEVSGKRRALNIESDGKRHVLSPVEWALDCMFRPGYAVDYPVFLVADKSLADRLGLPDLPSMRKRYSLRDLEAKEFELMSAAENPHDGDAIRLSNAYYRVKGWMMMSGILAGEVPEVWRKALPRWFKEDEGWSPVPRKNRVPGVVEAMAEVQAGSEGAETALGSLFDVLNRDLLTESEKNRIFLERLYYRVNPLRLALCLFAAGFAALVAGYGVKGAAGFAGRMYGVCGPGVRLPWVLGLAGGMALLLGLIARMAITMRPPVGNTHETVLFAICAGVFLTLALEWRNRKGIALSCGLLAGMAACMATSVFINGSGGDDMDPLVAVLRSNVLLSIHVSTIMLGYAAGLLAGVFAHFYLMAKPLGLLDGDRERQMERMIYGVLCLSLLFTVAGTVFGGVWGNEAWGRFWGWDPKENGALLVILWQLVLLHALLAGYVRSWGFNFGAAVLVPLIVFGWWGVNSLGVGLHSYGFSEAWGPLRVFYGVEMALLAILLVVRCRSRLRG